MIEQIKQELDRESDDFQLTPPRLRKHVYDLISELERLKKQLSESRQMKQFHISEEHEKANVQVEELRKALGKAGKFISAIMEFHGQNLQVANWHLNGDLEPWDNFFEENMDGDELEVIRQALERKVESA